MDWPSPEELAEHFVRPWYLDMMRLNACEYGSRLAPEIARVAVEASDDILVRLLRLGWRERVMGAWMSVIHKSDLLTAEILRQLEGSHGSLEAPPLATAAVVLAGADSMGSLAKYYEADLAADWGAASFIQQAAQYVRDAFGTPSSIPPTPDSRDRDFDLMIAVAQSIESG